MKIKSFGLLLLGVYLICSGLGTLFGIDIPSTIMGVLALVAGLLLIVGR